MANHVVAGLHRLSFAGRLWKRSSTLNEPDAHGDSLRADGDRDRLAGTLEHLCHVERIDVIGPALSPRSHVRRCCPRDIDMPLGKVGRLLPARRLQGPVGRTWLI